MNSFKLFFFSLSLLLLASCGSGNQKPSSLFSIELEGNPNKINQGATIGVSIKNIKNKNIEKTTYFMDGKELPIADGKINFSVPKLGNKVLKANITYEGTTVEVTKKLKVLASKAPEIYTYTILNEYPHDTGAYTQGLEFHNDTLYEGTGKKGRSFLRKFDYKTGKVYQQVDLDKTYFGEGITILNDKIYQLTWRSGVGFIYNLKDMKKLDNFQYGESREGWGLTNDGTKLYKSDGTEKIWILNPDTMQEEDHIEIASNKSLFADTNELEYVDGKIYANVYQKPGVMIIDAKSGAIEGVVNFGGLSDKVTKTENWIDTDNVLNGIAYHPTRKTFFVTGKDWDKLFEVQIEKK
ncbi:glutaminyl-peptide cyclotransferase [Maribacter thermophilus]|uniref:glutaminyl-peptide cyclotransferase n=1 Tax=Maribacter thermophilus TaxID=1197874 RepID=UPI000641362A|nr:glutaminyl-peptide cyclotransferase [Maribacter thermophilus]